jgi:integrase/recombinase XerD
MSQVLTTGESLETLGIRQILELLLTPEMRRKLELRQKTNKELFTLYDAELIFHYRTTKPLEEARRILGHFYDYLGEYPPSVENAKAYLAQFAKRKSRTLEKYASVLKAFFKWLGDDLDIHIKTGRQLPAYVEPLDIEKLMDGMRAQNKRTHKKEAKRDILLVQTATHTGLRRAELSNLICGDIDIERRLLLVRAGKGLKDRYIPLSSSICEQLAEWIAGKPKDESVFHLAASTISGKIQTFSMKSGTKIHAHSLRDYFATQLMETNANLRVIQELLGHSSLATTEKYTLLKPEHLASAVQRLDDAPARGTHEQPLSPQLAPPFKTKSTWKMSWEQPEAMSPAARKEAEE